MWIKGEAFDRAMKRAIVLRRMGVPFEDAGRIGLFLENRAIQHRKIGADLIYSEAALDNERWADLYRRTALHVRGKHLARLRAILDRLDLVVA